MNEDEKRFPADFVEDEHRKGSDRKKHKQVDFDAVKQENESLRKIIGEQRELLAGKSRHTQADASKRKERLINLLNNFEHDFLDYLNSNYQSCSEKDMHDRFQSLAKKVVHFVFDEAPLAPTGSEGSSFCSA